jgi:hypothetical protein
MKGVSFLPLLDYGAYPQMPYEAITKKEYLSKVARLKGFCGKVKKDSLMISFLN